MKQQSRTGVSKIEGNADISTIDEEPRFQSYFQSDASVVGVGAVLSQGEEEDQPIAYFSRKLLPREQAYSTVEKECLCIVLAVKNFKPYLL